MTSILSGAKDLILNACDFIDNSVITNETIGLGPGSGIQRLLKQSMPDAFHDSSARYPPPMCHYGTRQEYITLLTGWGAGDSESPQERVLWMDGPAGVGKSAVAQSSAELFAEQGRLAASIFFSRPNRRQDHNRFFTSISYQIATKWKPFADIVDLHIREDPTLVTKTMREQFLKLLVNPLQQLQNEGRSYAGGKVIVLDGLDECDTPEAQIDIVEIVAMSVRNQMTPFQWIFASRPERHLVTVFTSTKLQPLTFHIDLPVSRKSDHDILLYLTDEMTEVRQHFGLPTSWPSETEYAGLVDLSNGLFIYATTATRFIGDRRSVTGPIKRLQMVLRLAEKAREKSGVERPLGALDVFYSLIMQNIPPEILSTLQKILLLYEVIPRLENPGGESGEIVMDLRAIYISNILKLTELQFQSACSPLSSVLQVISTSWGADIAFYHASFLDFLADSTRSQQFSTEIAIEDLRRELLEYLSVFHAGAEVICAEMTWPYPPDVSWSCDPGTDEAYSKQLYKLMVHLLLYLCHNGPILAPKTAEGLLNFDFSRMLYYWGSEKPLFLALNQDELRQRIPIKYAGRIIRGPSHIYERFLLRKLAISSKCEREPCGASACILGQGRNRVVGYRLLFRGRGFDDDWSIHPYPTFSQSFRLRSLVGL